MTTNRQITDSSAGAGNLNGELALLFGRKVIARVQACDVVALDFSPADIVTAARELRRLSGQWKAQIAVARCLPEDVQAALCMWLADGALKAKLLQSKGVSLQ